MAFPRGPDIHSGDQNETHDLIIKDNEINYDKKDTTKYQYYIETYNQSCCVRTILMAIVVSTAIVMVVIVASHRARDGPDVKMSDPGKESVYWLQNTTQKRLVFEYQFLLRDKDNLQPVQILAINDVRRMYVLIWQELHKNYNLYMTVDFEKNLETFLAVSKSENVYATDIQENNVLFCQTKRFNRAFNDNFVTVKDVFLSGLSINFTQTKQAYQYGMYYISGPLILEQFISTVVNTTCDDLPKSNVFRWDKLDESLACGERVYSETELESCSRDFCQSFPGNPQSKGQICHQFRNCNYIHRSCDSFYHQNPRRSENYPYCICRKTAAKYADELTCPRVTDDGGECEIPRRDLLVTQRNQACLCSYRFHVIYPYISKPDKEINLLKENTAGNKQDHIQWYMKEENITGPALTFLQCPC